MSIQELAQLRAYNKETSSSGIIMPTRSEFDTKVKMAIQLWPQVNENGTIDYLFGKGVGVELALLGEVQNRKKNNHNFPYRSHSDFEIYNTLGYSAIPQSRDFVFVFGPQEIRTKTETKGLKSMPEDHMDRTFDTVIYQGNIYLIPELELLFLDKYIVQESTPRAEGCDALLLLSEYQLDIEKIIKYFHQYVKGPNMQIYDANMKGAYDLQVSAIRRLYQSKLDEAIEYNDLVTPEEIIEQINNEINYFRKKNPDATSGGLCYSLCPQKIEFVLKDGQIDISDSNKEEIKQLIIDARIAEEQKYDSILAEIESYYYQLYPVAKIK